MNVCVCVSDGSSEDGVSGLGSPSDPCMSPLAWSVTGKYLASAMEKLVNIWQVNGELSQLRAGTCSRCSADSRPAACWDLFTVLS